MKDFIGRYSVDLDLCDRLIEDFNRKPNPFTTHSNRGYTYFPSCDMDVDLITDYEQELNRVIRLYQQEYEYSKETICSYELQFPFNIQKYDPGQYYSVWHCENNGEVQYRNRHLAFMTYLNDVEDGGETEFRYQELKIKPKKGLTLVWPAYFTHTHRGSPSKTQEKYISTGWYTFFDTQNFLESQSDVSDTDFFEMLDKFNTKII